MSDKSKKFEPPMGWIVAVNHQQVAARHLARELTILPSEVAAALERAGYNLQPDYFDLAADTAKVLRIEESKIRAQQQEEQSHLQVVPDNVPEEGSSDNCAECDAEESE